MELHHFTQLFQLSNCCQRSTKYSIIVHWTDIVHKRIQIHNQPLESTGTPPRNNWN
jgi:hypothetical protein